MIVEHDFFWKMVPNWVYFGQGEDFNLTTELSEKVQYSRNQAIKNGLNEVILLIRPIPIVLVKCWKVAHWNAKKLLKNCQKSKKLLPKFQKLLPKFLAIFI